MSTELSSNNSPPGVLVEPTDDRNKSNQDIGVNIPLIQSNHARERLIERNITELQIQETIKFGKLTKENQYSCFILDNIQVIKRGPKLNDEIITVIDTNIEDKQMYLIESGDQNSGSNIKEKISFIKSIQEIKAYLNQVVDGPKILVIISLKGTVIDKQKKKLVIRFNANELLYFLSNHPRIKLVVYTAMMQKNVDPMLYLLFKNNDLKTKKLNKIDIFNQEFCLPDPNRKFKFIKNPTKVILEVNKRNGSNFDQTNTLIINENILQQTDFIRNVVPVKEFNQFDNNSNQIDDQELIYTLNQINSIIENYEADIRDKITELSYDEFKKQQNKK